MTSTWTWNWTIRRSGCWWPTTRSIDDWALSWTGRGKVKQTYHPNPAGTGRRIRLTGQVRHGEVRVHSGGIAELSAIASRDYLADARRAHGGTPTLDDPARAA